MDSKTIFDYCADFVKTPEFKKSMRPIIQLFLQEIYPYIYISMLLVFVAFFLILAIFVMLLKDKGNCR